MSLKTFLILTNLLIASHVALAGDAEKHIRRGHNLLEAGTSGGIGASVDGLAFSSVDGEPFYLDEVVEQAPCVLIFLSTKCPLAKRYTTRLKQLQQEFRDKGVRLFAVFPNSDETHDGVKQYALKSGFTFPCVRDVNGYLARRLHASMTPQAIVIDEDLVIRFRGAIDDHRYENRVQQRYLRDALSALVSGKSVPTPTTSSMGCSIHLDDSAGEGQITYTGHIARILQEKCQNCHRSGQVAPFALETYQDAVTWQTEIEAYTRERLMPPWKASPEVGHFSNDMSMTEKEIELIAKWVADGTPKGDDRDMPPKPKFNDDWVLGQPDMIVQMPETYAIGPEGEDDYRHFVIPYEASEDRFVEMIDVRPGNRSVVHHVIAYVDTSGNAQKLDAADPGPGYTRFGDVGFKPVSALGGWAPGMQPIKTPRGTGRWLPKKCDIVLQVHYYRTGFEEEDRTTAGLYFSESPHPVKAESTVVINHAFRIPAGASDYQVRAESEIKQASYLYGITPHMHLIGESMSVRAELPDGSKLPLVRIDDWDFNWQTTYRYRDLQFLPAGTKVELVATFDNSAANPNNPNSPPREIGWGEKTSDEMCIAFLGLVREADYDPKTETRVPHHDDN